MTTKKKNEKGPDTGIEHEGSESEDRSNTKWVKYTGGNIADLKYKRSVTENKLSFG